MGTHAPRASPAWRDEESPCALSLTKDSVDSFSSLSSMSTSTSTSAGTGEDPDRFVHPRRSPTFGFIKSSPTVNVYTTCGRHTDQLLFGGPSLSGFARAFLKPALKDG
ncbi:hypothetical protein ESCO_002393 [Escovopsis weberi]|uniref:Uncharacterized protein n=1 Tax=Escovopsis weberi TaxID=150374 RepID=A0A0M8MW58_ESCWE|nr:hypothetical protein ESCO_002393 [Escovopsis weberi]